MPMMQKKLSTMAIILLFTILKPVAAFALDFPLGSWAGSLQFEGQNKSIPVRVESFKYQPNDLDLFPQFQMHFRFNLGGLTSHEYFAQHFEHVHYDFDHGAVTLDSDNNDFIMSLTLSSSGNRPVLKGSVLSKSTGVNGQISVTFLTDEPDDSSNSSKPLESNQIIPELAGSYEGTCGTETALVQTMRGYDQVPDSRFPGISGYKIVSQLGFDDEDLCGPPPDASSNNEKHWCIQKAFDRAEYNVATGQLALGGWGGSPPCKLIDGSLTCIIAFADRKLDCSLTKKAQGSLPEFKVFPRLFSVATTPAQRKDLPLPTPPDSKELTAALTGSYYGFLHHETLDRYQGITVKVIATVSSENPHNPNMVYISGTSILGFNNESGIETKASVPFDRKAFYVKNGFTLDSNDSDIFIQIAGWKQGYILGTLYSRQFGKVGTVQLVKDNTPTIDAAAAFISSPLGSFIGPLNSDHKDPYWEVQLSAETQISSRNSSTVHFRGQLAADSGRLATRPIVRGEYDSFSQSVSFMTDYSGTGRFASGSFAHSGLSLVFPSLPSFGYIMNDQFLELNVIKQ
jgi:hypothetical protein